MGMWILPRHLVPQRPALGDGDRFRLGHRGFQGDRWARSVETVRAIRSLSVFLQPRHVTRGTPAQGRARVSRYPIFSVHCTLSLNSGSTSTPDPETPREAKRFLS